MGDQQAKLDLAWLGGIMDGEGCFHLSLQKTKWETREGEHENIFVRPQIKLCNTYKDGLEMVVKILKKYEIAHYVHWRTPTNPRYKRSWDISIVGFNSCIKFCQIMKGYIIWKADDMENMRKFCESRMNRMHDPGWRGLQLDLRKMPRFTEEELGYIAKLRNRDIRGKLV